MNKAILFGVTGLMATTAMAADIKKLPAPDLKQSTPALMELINSRHSCRDYDANKDIDDQTLSEILWAAFGVNKWEKRSIPTARNEQNLKVFVLKKEGIWLYNAEKNQLEKISDENAIGYAGENQDYVKDAPVHLIYTSSDKHWGYAHAGSAYQNVYLYATAKGVATIVRGWINTEKLHKALKLSADEDVLIHQALGYEKTK